MKPPSIAPDCVKDNTRDVDTVEHLDPWQSIGWAPRACRRYGFLVHRSRPQKTKDGSVPTQEARFDVPSPTNATKRQPRRTQVPYDLLQ